MNDFVFLFRISPSGQQEAMGTPERAQQSMQKWLAWIQQLEANGNLAARGQPLDRAGKVVRGQKKLVIDGPYLETKDIVAGFLTVRARDLVPRRRARPRLPDTRRRRFRRDPSCRDDLISWS